MQILYEFQFYQGEHVDGTNPLLNNWVYDVVTGCGESIKLLPEGSDVDITIKVDRSENDILGLLPAIDHARGIVRRYIKPETAKIGFLECPEISMLKRTAKSK